jgi:hypothetical protein
MSGAARGTLGRTLAGLLSCALLAGCAELRPGAPRPPVSPSADAEYAAAYPYYAETCAISQLNKKSGYGAELFGGIGGHQVMYLNGVCRVHDEAYPVLGLCDELPQPTADGVGLSVNAHYRNATWVAIEGRDFFFAGGLPPEAALTRESYQRVQAAARAQRIYEGIDFRDRYFEDMPAGFTRGDYRYELSVATDYAVGFGRNRYCARVPLSRTQMRKVVGFLNEVNAPYQAGRKQFDWNVLSHNCAHINHNALAAAAVWSEWPMDRNKVISALDFPTPMNEFVHLMARTNDLPIEGLAALFEDREARVLLLGAGRLPTEPGAIADFGGILRPNEVYGTESKMIFYDLTATRSFQRRFDEILSQPRYLRLRDNLEYFAARYRRILAARRPLEHHLARHRGMTPAEANEFREFYARYYEYIESESNEVGKKIAVLQGMSPEPPGAVSP